jgi:hypothetical protein
MASFNSNDSNSVFDNETDSAPTSSIPSGVIPTTADSRAKRRIAALEDELERMRQERGTKQR